MTTRRPPRPPLGGSRRRAVRVGAILLGALLATVLLAAGTVVVVAGLPVLAGGEGGALDPAAPEVRTTAPAPAAAPDEPAGAPSTVPMAPATAPPAPASSPTVPVRVVLPAQRIDVPVDPVGVAADGQMEIPPLAERGGWYRFGADPGDPAGTTVVAAHVDSVASGGTGPFVRLREVRPGDRVEVTLADGSTRAYVVQDVTQLPKSQARWPDVFTRDGPPRLALVTCGGAFDRDTRHYLDNILVTAAPAEP